MIKYYKLYTLKYKSITMLLFIVFLCFSFKVETEINITTKVEKTLRKDILKQAEWALKQEPVTVTASFCERSAGRKNDFYSEGDYWWPNPVDLDGPYIQKDGITNPNNFVAHRLAMIRFSRIVGTLASAYKLTGNLKYAKHAQLHLNAWFVSFDSKMNPNLLYAQAIKGRFTGRGIGIIDTIHLIEVTQGVIVLQNVLDKNVLEGVKLWFGQYLDWLMSHPYGEAEMNAKNNHGTCFVMQVAAFAKLTANKKIIDFAKDRYKNVLLPNQMAANGSFPLETVRTKPYGYSIFNLDAMATICHILSTKEDNLWYFKDKNNHSLEKAVQFLYPYILDKNAWPFAKDVMYWEEWPVAQPFLLFAGKAYQNANWINSWAKGKHNLEVEEVVRNMPIKYPLIWM